METTDYQVFTAIGVLGCALYVVSYFLLQMEYIEGNDCSYAVLNLFASIFMLMSLIQAFNLGAAILQIIWIVISAIGIAKKMSRRLAPS